MAPSSIPLIAEINTLLSKFNTALDDALRKRSFSLEQAQDITAAVACSLSALHRYQNTFLPIGTLPPEVLIRVFELVVAPPSDIYNTVEPYKQAQWAITLARVCSSWRSIALETSRLWSHIVSGNPTQAKLFLHRSRSAGIHFYVYLSIPSSKPNDIWQDVIQNHSHRVHELHMLLNVNDTVPSEELLNTLSIPLPALKFLTIHSSNPYSTPPLIFGGLSLQNLKALVLDILAPFIPGNLLPNLANLQLYGGKGVLTAQNLLRLLSNCPRLETFELLSPSSLFFDFDEWRGPQPIPLRSLKALWMRDLDITPALALLCRLELPPETTVRLANLADYSRYERPTGSLIPDGCRSPFKHIEGLTHLDILEDDQQGVHNRYPPLCFVAHGARAGIWIHLKLTTNDAHARDQLFWQLLDMLPTAHVTTLRVSAPAAASFARIEWVLKRTPALAELVLRCGHAGATAAPGAVPHHVLRLQGASVGGDGASAKKHRTVLDDVAHALAPRGTAEVRVPVPYLKALTIEVDGTWDAKLADGFVKALAQRIPVAVGCVWG